MPFCSSSILTIRCKSFWPFCCCCCILPLLPPPPLREPPDLDLLNMFTNPFTSCKKMAPAESRKLRIFRQRVFASHFRALLPRFFGGPFVSRFAITMRTSLSGPRCRRLIIRGPNCSLRSNTPFPRTRRTARRTPAQTTLAQRLANCQYHAPAPRHAHHPRLFLRRQRQLLCRGVVAARRRSVQPHVLLRICLAQPRAWSLCPCHCIAAIVSCCHQQRPAPERTQPPSFVAPNRGHLSRPILAKQTRLSPQTTALAASASASGSRSKQ